MALVPSRVLADPHSVRRGGPALEAAMDSKTVFAEAVKDLELDVLMPKFIEEGWDTFANFAFCVPDFSGKDAAAFEPVLDTILAKDDSQKKLKTRLRRLYAQAYYSTSSAMSNEPETSTVTTIVMHKSDRVSRTEALRKRIVGFRLEHLNLPSNSLIDKANTILVKGVVRIMAWIHCTSRQQENKHEPEVRGLRLTAEGNLTQDVAKELQTEIRGEMLWDYAIRRRSLACDIGGLMAFESGNSWHEEMKEALLKKPPAGCCVISWSQIKDADEALWDFVAERCEAGTKLMPGEKITNFEKFWLEGMRHTDVLQHLHFQKSSAGSSGKGGAAPPSDADGKLAKKLDIMREEMQGLKRKLGKGQGQRDQQGNSQRGKGKKGAKGGKGHKGAKGGGLPADGVPRNAEHCRGMHMRINGERCCWDFHLPHGCSKAQPGAWCDKGWHLCPKCKKAHSLQVPCP